MVSKKLLVCRNERFERPSRRREENDVRPAVDSDRRRARPDWLLSARPLSLVRRASSPSASSSHSQSPTPASTRWRVAHEPPPYTRENDSKKKRGSRARQTRSTGHLSSFRSLLLFLQQLFPSLPIRHFAPSIRSYGERNVCSKKFQIVWKFWRFFAIRFFFFRKLLARNRLK